MIKDRDKYEMFENYLKGKLESTEITELKNLLSASLALQKEFEDYKQVHQLVTDSYLLDIKRELSKIHTKQTYINNTWRNLKYIISTAGVIVIAIFIFRALQDNRVNSLQSIPVIHKKSDSVSVINKSDYRPFITQTNEPARSKVSVLEERTKSFKTGSDSTKVNLVQPTHKDSSLQANRLDTVTPTKQISQPRAEMNKKQSKTKSAGIPKNIDCSKIFISGKFDVDNACIGSANGRIIFKQTTVKGGISPYLYSIDNGHSFSFQTTFEELTYGNYSLIIKDKNNCASNLGNAEVKEAPCAKDYIFAPEHGELWSIPAERDKTGTLYITTKKGALVYTAKIGPNNNTEWDGKTTGGIQLAMDVYVFKIVFTDGTFQNGTVTIVK